MFNKKDALKDFANFFISKKLQHCESFKSACSKEHLRATASVYLKSKLLIMQFTHKPKTFNFMICKVFSYLFSFTNFSSTKIYICFLVVPTENIHRVCKNILFLYIFMFCFHVCFAFMFTHI